MLGTCQYNRRDIRIAHKIFGPSKAAIEGKSTKCKANMDRQDHVVEDLPPEVMSEHCDVHLDIDIIFVNKIAFLTAISRDLRMIHAQAIRNRTNKKIKATLKSIKAVYEKRGFKVQTIHGDNEFAPLNEWVTEKDMSLETCDTNAHVPAIERTNRFLKERIQCIRMDMPFTRIPRRLVIKTVNQATKLINSIPRCGGVHDAMSARELVTGKVLRIPPCGMGEYVHGHKPTSNDTGKPRTVEGLYLGLNGNGSGHYIFKLSTKQKILLLRITAVPMPESIINLLNKMGEEEGKKEGIEFWDIFGSITINNIELGISHRGLLDDNNNDDDDDDDDDDNDSNASDPDYKLKEKDDNARVIKDEKIDKEEKNIIGNKELQQDHFDTAIDKVSIKTDDYDYKSAVKEEVEYSTDDKQSTDKATTDGKDDESEDGRYPHDYSDKAWSTDNHNTEDANDPTEDEESVEDNTANDAPKVKRPRILYKIESSLSNYWDGSLVGAAMNVENRAMQTMAGYAEMTASLAMPQYSFQKGLEIFGDTG